MIFNVEILSSVSRRAVLTSGLAVAACSRDLSVQSQIRAPLADAHVHLFNAADLPIAGFLKYVFYAKYIGTPPKWAAAMIDFVTFFVKPLAKSASAELQQIDTYNDLTPEQFGKAASDYIRGRGNKFAMAPDAESTELAASYRDLVETVAAETGVKGANQGDEKLLMATDINPVSFARAAAGQSDNTVGPSPEVDFKYVAGLGIFGKASRTIAWAFVLTHSRASHIDQYLSKFMSADRAPRKIGALLVDYDDWLDDAPATGSSMQDQIRVMDALRNRYSAKVDIRLFAGVCPLKLAIETAAKKPHPLFEEIVDFQKSGKVHGFKLYPPMGFMPLGNIQLKDDDFSPPPTRRATALEKWNVVSSGSLGAALDDALTMIFETAVARRIPIVAHAGPGNEAGPGYGARANPIYWQAVVAKHNIRLSLGHLVNDAKPFITAVENGMPYPQDVWSLHASLQMLDRRQSNPPDVYGDLSYMPELIDAPELARRFFLALRQVFGPGDPQLERILYGTDWIMLGRERHDSRILEAMEGGMRDAGYSPMQIENILWRNGERFLG